MAKTKKQTKSKQQEARLRSKKKRTAIALGITIPLAAAGAGVGIYYGVKSCQPNNKLSVEYLGKDTRLGTFVFEGEIGKDTTITFQTKAKYVLDGSTVKITINGKKLKAGIDYSISGNTITIKGSAVTANKIYISASATIKSSEQKGNVELSQEVADQDITVKSKDIEVGKESSFELNIPSGTKITAMTLLNGNAVLTYPNDFSIVDNVITIPAKNVLDATVTVATITLIQKTVGGLSLDFKSKSVKVNQSFDISAEILYENEQDYITWVYNSAYLQLTEDRTVSEQYTTVTPIQAGETQLVATCNGKSATCDISISEQEATITGITVELTDSTRTYTTGDCFKPSSLTVYLEYDGVVDRENPVSWGQASSSGNYYQIGYQPKDGATFVPFTDFGNSGHDITAEDVAAGTVALRVQYKTDEYIYKDFSIQASSPELKKITVSPSTVSLSMVVGPKTQQLTATFEPSSISPHVNWWVDESAGVVSVDQNGNVTALKAGTAEVWCYDDTWNPEIAGSATINIDTDIEPVTGVLIAEESPQVALNKTTTLHATVYPESATYKDLIWTSSDDSVATVTDGVVKGVGLGTATITATALDHTLGERKDTCNVEVLEYLPPEDITVTPDSLTLTAGEAGLLKATVLPEDALQKVTWTSRVPTIATVDEDGIVTAVSSGETIIDCKTVATPTQWKTITVTVNAKKVIIEGVDYETVRDDECLVRAGANAFTETSITIPEKLTVDGKEKKVTGIASSGFATNGETSTIEEFKFPYADQIKYIGDGAFSGNSSLTTFTWPNNVESLQKQTFYGCSALTTLTIDSTNSKLKSIGFEAFGSCEKLASLVLPASLTTIESQAFRGSSVTSVQFKNESNWRQPLILQPVDVSSSYEKNAEYLINFTSGVENNWGFTGLTTDEAVLFTPETSTETTTTCRVVITDLGKQETGTLTIPSTLNGKTVVGIGTGGLSYMSATAIQFPSTTTNPSLTFGDSAFAHTPLQSIEIPSSVTAIPDYAFQNCQQLTSVKLNENLISIGTKAFDDCTALETLNIPSTVTTLSSYALYNCGTNEDAKEFTVTFDGTSKLQTISSYCFGISRMKKITIPASVTLIDQYAFQGCANLASVSFEDSENKLKLAEGSFNQATAFTSFTIPSRVNYIGAQSFYGCRGCSNITFENKIGWVTTSAPTTYLDVASDTTTNAENLNSGIWCNVDLKVVDVDSVTITGSTHQLEADPDSEEATIQLSANFGGLDVTDDATWTVTDSTGTVVATANKGEFKVSKKSGASATVKCSYTYGGTTYEDSYELEVATWSNITFDSSTDYVSGDSSQITTTNSEVILPTRYWKTSGTTTVETPVTTIAASGFSDCTNLTSIYISSSITTIQAEAFSGCTSLANATFANTSGWQQTGWGDISVETPATNAANLVDCTEGAATGTNWGTTGIVKQNTETVTLSYVEGEGYATTNVTLKPNTTYIFTIESIAAPGIDTFQIEDSSDQIIHLNTLFDVLNAECISGSTTLTWQYIDDDGIIYIPDWEEEQTAGDKLTIKITTLSSISKTTVAKVSALWAQ